MTAAEYQALAKEAEQEAAVYEHLTEAAKLSGAVFDYNAPLPPMPDYRSLEWETRVEYFGRLQVHQPARPKPKPQPQGNK